MASAHDELIFAFRQADPLVSVCSRGADSQLLGYSHIHGPNQSSGTKACYTHSITILQVNGTVSIRTPVMQALGGAKRPDQSVMVNPIGHTSGPGYGEFDYAITANEILVRWGSFLEFARDVIAIEVRRGRW
jgi:hypothetical protein